MDSGVRTCLPIPAMLPARDSWTQWPCPSSSLVCTLARRVWPFRTNGISGGKGGGFGQDLLGSHMCLKKGALGR